MTEPEHDRHTAATLDELGRAAVRESPDVPPAPAADPTSGASSRRWLVAAAVMALVGGSVLWWAGREETVDQVAGPDPTTSPAPAARDVDLQVTIGDPSGPDGTRQATLTNLSDRRVGLDCAVWRLDRWDGTEWQVVAVSAMWDENGQLALFDTELTLDCGGTAFLAPGASTQRPIVPAWTVRVPSRRELDSGADTVAEPLTPGTYRLVLPARPPHTVQAREPIEADARLVVGADDVAPTTVPTDCVPLGRTAIAEVLGEPAASPPTTLPPTTVAGDPAPAPDPAVVCAAESGPWFVGYELGELDPAARGDLGVLGEPLEIGDEAYLSTGLDRSGLWTATGFLRVGERAVTLSVRSSAEGADTYPPGDGPAVGPVVQDRTVALLEALAERL